MSNTVPLSDSSFSALIQLLRYAKGYRRRIVLASSCSALNTLFDIMPEILIGIAIDVVVNREASFLAGFGFQTPQSQILMLGVLTFVIWAGESIFQYLYLILWRNLAQDLQADLRQDAYDQVQSQDMGFFETRSSGELTAILNDDVNQLERFLDGGANDFLQVFVSVTLIGTVFFVISPSIAVLAFTPIPLIIWGAFYFMRRATPLYADVRQCVADLASRLSNNIGGMATIKAFTAERRESERLRLASRDYVQANRRAIKVSSAFVPLIRMAILAGFLATFVIGGLKALDGTLNVGAYGMLVFLTQRLLWPLTMLAQTVDLFERAMASTRRILTLITSQNRVRDEGTLLLSGNEPRRIRFDSMSFEYPGTHSGVKNMSLDIQAGTTMALVGATGSGKSTLIKLLLRFYPVSGGSISIDGVLINQLSLRSLRESIGLVSQEVFLFEGSIWDNIAYGNPDASKEQVRQAALAAEAMEFIEHLPHGFDTLVGERGIKLSGGQRQRLSLARAILKNPPILILDEATSAVDNETEAAIQRSLAIISKKRTVLVVAHRLSTIVAADRIVVMEKGNMVEQGTHEELVSLNGFYARQWAVQTGAVQQGVTTP
ncbi:ABC transporter ATP-binding protein [Granulosicoccus antarcticus]|uniref:Multidrug export ATP-binding/permease protein n=1 Tax=Granulosicoccus antarcticus IMCC3135 TaxID=1192854 RepID=A0A2Z2NW13_9GAMM|nr:ABC transporter ATP-binding protein [Granulosicoccus antarcticus]ASJ71867.1 Putative multidrug export ATP-binding/permease protein [Granulosicoccus antarcticus IMCC3135]